MAAPPMSAGSPQAQAAGDEDARRLRSLLEAGPSSIGEIVTACHRVETVARQLPRAFFRSCFPVLLRRIFGFENLQAAVTHSGGWLSIVSESGNEAASGVVVSLLSPGGTLMRSMLAADKENVVRYVFPFERLPDWVRRLLSLEQGASILEQVSLLYKNRLKEDVLGAVQVELDVFQYYMFWFAYYTVCKEGSTTTSGKKRPGVSRSAQLRTQIENWAFSIPGLHQLPHQGTVVSPLHPYLQLLQLYLSHFIGPSVFQKSSISSLWQADNVSHADILIRTLIDFWLIDDDLCPFPMVLRVRLPAPASIYVPPPTELTDAVKLLINYFGALLQNQGNRSQLFSGPETGVYRRKAGILTDIQSSPALTAAVSPYILSLQRPLYRFLVRALCCWPVSTPLSRMVPIIDVWLHFLEPWAAVLLVPKGNNVQSGSSTNREYSGYWLDYVISNYPFYTSMTLHFLEFALKFLHVDMELVFQITCKVLNVLAKSSDLLDVLRRVEAASHALSGEHHYMNKPFADRVPAIHDQLKDWEEGVPYLEQEHGDMTLPSFPLKTPRLRFFSGSDKTARRMLEEMISQADAEMRACGSERAPMSAKTLQDSKELVRRIYQQETGAAATSPTSARRQEAITPPLAAAFTDSAAGLGKHTWAEVKYKGDWMLRPIETHEIAWLVRWLVKLSTRLNIWLGLTPGGRSSCSSETTDDASESWAKLPVPETAKPILKAVQAVCICVREQLKRWGFRVNLRPLGDKQVIGLLSRGSLLL